MYRDVLSDKVVVITGASSGFGKGAARRFAARGASLVLAARRDDLLQELAADCRADGRSRPSRAYGREPPIERGAPRGIHRGCIRGASTFGSTMQASAR